VRFRLSWRFATSLDEGAERVGSKIGLVECARIHFPKRFVLRILAPWLSD